MKYILTILLFAGLGVKGQQGYGTITIGRLSYPVKISNANGMLTTTEINLNIDTCQHIYVALEQPEIKMENTSSLLGIIYMSKVEGKELVCIKCHKIIKQVIDYGTNPLAFALDSLGHIKKH